MVISISILKLHFICLDVKLKLGTFLYSRSLVDCLSSIVFIFYWLNITFYFRRDYVKYIVLTVIIIGMALNSIYLISNGKRLIFLFDLVIYLENGRSEKFSKWLPTLVVVVPCRWVPKQLR